MAAGGVVAFELKVYFCGGIKLLFKVVRPYQRRRPVYLIHIHHLAGDIDEAGSLVKLLM